MQIEDFKLNEYELISYKDLREAFWNDYPNLYKWLKITNKWKQLSSHWINAEIINDYIKLKEPL